MIHKLYKNYLKLKYKFCKGYWTVIFDIDITDTGDGKYKCKAGPREWGQLKGLNNPPVFLRWVDDLQSYASGQSDPFFTFAESRKEAIDLMHQLLQEMEHDGCFAIQQNLPFWVKPKKISRVLSYIGTYNKRVFRYYVLEDGKIIQGRGNR